MKRLIVAGFALALLVPACAFAQSAFNGTWKTDVNSMKGTGTPAVIHLKDGMYESNSVPPIKVKADGEDHAVTGHPGFDTVAIKVLNDHSIQETDKKDGKVVSTWTITVAADGKTATYEFTNDSGASPVTGKLMVKRIAKGAPGSNAVAGTWQFEHYGDISASALTASYKVDGDTVSFSDPTGDSYTAKINGKAVPYTDGSGITGTTVSVKRLGKRSLRETFSRDGKVTSTNTMTVAANGQTMKTVSHNMRMKRSMTSVAHKQ
ncbi:MAG: hypothetical protein ACREP2_06040 [Rhodanobacteraceae bacterium]